MQIDEKRGMVSMDLRSFVILSALSKIPVLKCEQYSDLHMAMMMMLGCAALDGEIPLEFEGPANKFCESMEIMGVRALEHLKSEEENRDFVNCAINVSASLKKNVQPFGGSI